MHAAMVCAVGCSCLPNSNLELLPLTYSSLSATHFHTLHSACHLIELVIHTSDITSSNLRIPYNMATETDATTSAPNPDSAQPKRLRFLPLGK